MSRPARLALAAVIIVCGSVPGTGAAETAAELRNRGITADYNLDYDLSRRLLEQAVQIDATDPVTHRALAAQAWLRIQFARGALTVDHYLGSLTRAQVALRTPPPDLAALFRRHVSRAVTLTEARVAGRANDVNALYDYGASIALQASYTATVEGRVLAGFRDARRAYDAHERVLELAPARRDAGLIVGTYRYIVGSMSWPLRVMAYVAGFGGDKTRGLRLVEEAAAYPGATQVEARFALVLLYNRERRYYDALRVLTDLRGAYPRNRLLWLETAATALRGGRAAEAARWLDEGFTRLRGDTRQRMFGEEALWYTKRGEARLALGGDAEARTDLLAALGREARAWVHARDHLHLGEIADRAGDRATALREYALAVPLAEQDNDASTARAAKKLTRAPARLPVLPR